MAGAPVPWDVSDLRALEAIREEEEQRRQREAADD
jgi:hypothetical protein